MICSTSGTRGLQVPAIQIGQDRGFASARTERRRARQRRQGLRVVWPSLYTVTPFDPFVAMLARSQRAGSLLKSRVDVPRCGGCPVRALLAQPFRSSNRVAAIDGRVPWARTSVARRRPHRQGDRQERRRCAARRRADVQQEIAIRLARTVRRQLVRGFASDSADSHRRAPTRSMEAVDSPDRPQWANKGAAQGSRSARLRAADRRS